MDLFDPQRHLVYSGTVTRKYGSEWRDVTLYLLDNFGKLPRFVTRDTPNKFASDSSDHYFT